MDPDVVSDIIAIQQLVARYCHALDAGDGEGWAACFVEEGSFETIGSPKLQGRAAIAGALRNRTPFASRHFPANMIIEVDGDEARMRAYLQVLRNHQISVTGNYEDVLRRTPDGWLFVERRFTRDPDAEARS